MVPPKLRDDLVTVRQETDGAVFIVLKDPITQRYFRLREPEYWLISQFNGVNDLETIAAGFQEKFNLKVSPQAVGQFAAKIDSLYFFDNSKAEYEVSSGRYLGERRRSLLSRLLFVKLRAFSPDRLLNFMVSRLRFMFSPWAIGLMIFFILAGLLTYVANFSGFAFVPSELFNIASLVIIIVSLSVIIFIHEFAHALTCKYFGGQVHEMGFLLLYFQLCFYSNLSDSWLFQEKYKRLAVIWAGLFFQLFLFAVAVFAWRITVIGTAPNHFFWLTANVGLFTMLFNFNPLLKLDAYYFVSELVNIPNLRDRSFTYMKTRIQKLLGMDITFKNITRRERRIYFWYTFLAGIYTVVLLAYVAVIVFFFLTENLGGWGFILFLALLVLIFRSPVTDLVKFFCRHEVLMALFTNKRNVIVGSIVAIILIVLFFIIPFPRRAGGDIVIQPADEFTITMLSGQGLLETNLRRGGEVREFHTQHIQLLTGDLTVLQLTPLVREGQFIKEGDTLAAIISNQVSTFLESAQAELGRLENELALALSPPKPEEVDQAEAEVGAARVNKEQLQRELERNRQLFEKKLISEQALEQSEFSLNVASSEYDEALAKLTLLNSPPKKEEVDILKSQIVAQQSSINYYMTQEAAQVITSPIAGELTALYRNNLLFKVARLDQVEAAVPVTDNYLEYLEDSAEASVKVRTYPDEVFKGHVIYIARSADTQTAEDNRARFRVYVLLDNDNRLLKDGMSGYAKISCGEASLIRIIMEKIMAFIRVEFWSWW